MSTVGIKASEGMESPVPPPPGESVAVTVKPPDTVFSVLAAQARARTTTELRTTALGCAVSAGLLFWQHPALSWLASAFLAASAYGTGACWTVRSSTSRSESDPIPERFGFYAVGERSLWCSAPARRYTRFSASWRRRSEGGNTSRGSRVEGRGSRTKGLGRVRMVALLS